MESKLKAAAQDSVGELPAGYLHLPTTPIKQEPKLTDRFNGAMVKPYWEGVYMVGDGLYQHFNGYYWGVISRSIEEALRNKNSKSMIQNCNWRGLSSNPNEVQS